jgi:hypothetical protein
MTARHYCLVFGMLVDEDMHLPGALFYMNKKLASNHGFYLQKMGQ